MKIYFTSQAWHKMHALTQKAEGEVQGLGRVDVRKGNIVVVDEIAIFEQDASSASTETNKDEMMKFMYERVKEGDASKWRLWWHSHASMGTFFSGTDTTFIDDTAGETADWLLSLVTNKAGDISARLDCYRPFRITVNDVTAEMMQSKPKGIDEWAQQEIDAKVKKSHAGYDWGKSKKAENEEERSDVTEDANALIRAERLEDNEEAFNSEMCIIQDRLEAGLPLTKVQKILYRRYPNWFSNIVDLDEAIDKQFGPSNRRWENE